MRSGRNWAAVALLTGAVVLAACGGSSKTGKGTTSGEPLPVQTGTTLPATQLTVAASSTKASAHASSTATKPTNSAAATGHTSTPGVSATHSAPHITVTVAPACAHNPDTYTGAQHITVTPNTCLSDGQTVTVNASGFPAGHLVVVIECADKGDATGQADCDKTNFTHVDASGHLNNYHLKVYVHLSGSNHIVCSAAQPCLVSVSIPALTHAQEADRRITFA